MAELSQHAYNRFVFNFGKDVADSIAAEVMSGERDVESAEEWARNLDEMSNRKERGRNVPPKYWRDWEDGEWP